jgi:hypothetical protein
MRSGGTSKKISLKTHPIIILFEQLQSSPPLHKMEGDGTAQLLPLLMG